MFVWRLTMMRVERSLLGLLSHLVRFPNNRLKDPYKMYKFYWDSLQTYSAVPLSLFTRLVPFGSLSRGVDPKRVRLWKRWSGTFLTNKVSNHELEPLQSGFNIFGLLWSSRKALVRGLKSAYRFTPIRPSIKRLGRSWPVSGPVLAIAWTGYEVVRLLGLTAIILGAGLLLSVGVDGVSWIITNLVDYFWGSFVHWAYMLPFWVYDLPWSEGLSLDSILETSGVPYEEEVLTVYERFQSYIFGYFLFLIGLLFFGYFSESVRVGYTAWPAIIAAQPPAPTFWDMCITYLGIWMGMASALIWEPLLNNILDPWMKIIILGFPSWDKEAFASWSQWMISAGSSFVERLLHLFF